jgi:hypothetical protein
MLNEAKMRNESIRLSVIKWKKILLSPPELIFLSLFVYIAS